MSLLKSIRGIKVGKCGKQYLTIEVYFPISQEFFNFVDNLTDIYYIHDDKINECKVFIFSIEIPTKYINKINEIIQNQCFAILESTNDNKLIRMICELFIKYIDSGSAEFFENDP